MTEKEREAGGETWVERIEHEKFVDDWVCYHKKGMFAIDFGQGISDPPKMTVRLWIQPVQLKQLVAFLQERIKEYEKDYGKIE